VAPTLTDEPYRNPGRRLFRVITGSIGGRDGYINLGTP
jgi:hypothetical protein